MAVSGNANCQRTHDLRKWDKISRKGIDAFMKSRPADFWRRVHKGIPPEHRWAVWQARLLAANSVVNCREVREREKALFSGPNAHSCTAGLLSRESTWSQAIRADAHRTLPEHPGFTEEHQLSFCRVLNAYAFLNPKVGYVQGMGYVVGLLLLVSERAEHETLFVFARLMEDCGLAGFYREGLPMLEEYVQNFDQLMEELVPRLRTHFANEGIQSSDFLHKWLLSLFAGCLPLQTVLLIWDVVMCNGLPHLVLAAIALLVSIEEVLLGKRKEEIMQFFATMKYSEDELSAIEVGRCLSRQIGEFSKMPNVQKKLGIAPDTLPERRPPADSDENAPNFDLDNQERPKIARTNSKKRVSFSLDTDLDTKDGSISWYRSLYPS